MNYPQITRRSSRSVQVGRVQMGGGAPVSIQSMTNTPTADARATLAQIDALAAAGCEIIRVATPTPADTAALKEIVANSPLPVVADVHFHFERALEAIEAGVAKIRLNPGNIGEADQVRRVIAACKDRGVAIRVGVNEGSVTDRINKQVHKQQMDRPLVELMVETISEYLDVFAESGFENLVLSAKSSDAFTCIEVYRRLAEKFPYPLHLGLTHAGTAQTGVIRSSVALGGLLAEGIGDTVRISLAGDPVNEVHAAKELLACLRLRARKGVEIIACPTCGRTEADVAAVAEEVRQALVGMDQHVRVAVMGCIVNGPGEAEGADVAACFGKGKAAIYRQGKLIRGVDQANVLAALLEEVRAVLHEKDARG